MERFDTSGAVSKRLKYTIAATGSLALSGAGVLHVAAAPVGSTIAHSQYGWNGWSLGFGASFDSYRTSVSSASSSEVYGSDFSSNLKLTDLKANLEIGKDFRSGSHVFGVYGDVFLGNTSTNFGSSDTYDGPGGSLTLQERASLTGRAGVLVTPNTLLYGLAGWSVQHYTASISAETYGGTFGATHSGFMSGPTVGVGAEMVFPGNPLMSLKGEYRFTHFSAPTLPTASDGYGSVDTTFKPVDDSAFRVILSLKLGP